MLFQWGKGDAPCQQCMNGEVTSRLDHSRLDFLHHTCLRVLPTSNKKIRNSSQRPFLCFRIAFLWIILNSAFGPITGFRAILVSLSCLCAVFERLTWFTLAGKAICDLSHSAPWSGESRSEPFSVAGVYLGIYLETQHPQNQPKKSTTRQITLRTLASSL